MEKNNFNEREDLVSDLIAKMLVHSILNITEGNTGSIKCIMAIIHPDNNIISREEKIDIMHAFKDGNIHGNGIYVFCDDICDNDLRCIAYVAKHTPSELLTEACSLEDYSGRVLLKDQLAAYKVLSKEAKDED